MSLSVEYCSSQEGMAGHDKPGGEIGSVVSLAGGEEGTIDCFDL